MRDCPRGRSSNREGTWSAAHLEVGGQAGSKIPETGPVDGQAESEQSASFQMADDTPGNTDKRRLGETRPDHSLWSLGEQVISR
jgi:hypothetical protein